MDNAQKAIMIGVGLFITIIIISAVLLITNLGTDLIDSAAGEVGNMTEGLQRELVRTYDGKTLTGKQMLDCVEKYIGSDTVGIVIRAANAGASKTLYFGATKLTLSSSASADSFKVGGTTVNSSGIVTKVAKMSSASTYADATTYILSADAFKTTLVYNTDGVLVGIAAIEL